MPSQGAHTTTAIAQSIEDWAHDTCALNTYAVGPKQIRKALDPGLAIAKVKRDRLLSDQDPDLPNVGAYQQTLVRVWTVDLMIMVSPDEDEWNASQLLYGFVDTLGASIRKDATLGQRVRTTSPLYDASYDPPEVEYADGTVARLVTMTLIVGEPLEV